MSCIKYFFLAISLLMASLGTAQEIPILSISSNENGQVELEINSDEDHYYILNIRHGSTGDFIHHVSMTLGSDGTTILTESLENYPIDHYQVLEHDIDAPVDTDEDGVDDITEYENFPDQNPLNTAEPIDFENGVVGLDNLIDFKEMSVEGEDIPWAPYLNGQEFVKFTIEDVCSDTPKLYFVNTENHGLHSSFMNAVGIDWNVQDVQRGEITYYPSVLANNGTLGTFAFSYSVGEGRPFEIVQKSQEIMAASMPFLKNNLSYFVTTIAQEEYEMEQDLYESSRVSVLLESELFDEIDYLSINAAEGFGLLRVMDLEEIPNSRDIVIYESLPNNLPRVGGIITSFFQTPLSHVNLRAIQDNIPNAYIREPLALDSINDLVGSYVYFKAEQGGYTIRAATLDEVNDWYDDIRPDGVQNPPLNLTHTSILSLDELDFDMSDGYGSKSANVATMKTFGFPNEVVPDGFAVPFYFYQEFMEYNGFFNLIENILANPNFHSDLTFRMQELESLRNLIENGLMPMWMMDELQTMQESFGTDASIRCRSSSNNEDLPGFSGAGLYTSKTQHPWEGHISKSIKEVYAGMWNFRAYDERDFYRVDHYRASMGVLCHPNFVDEKANGVGLSLDPIYQTVDTYYLNTQLGDALITNPAPMSVPEEILLDRVSITEDDYSIIRYSNLVQDSVLIMDEIYLDQIRSYLTTIHEEFAVLYDAVGQDDFAMDIEYKITSDDQLVIKQARPWAGYWSTVKGIIPFEVTTDVLLYPNPAEQMMTMRCDCQISDIVIYNLFGQVVHQQSQNHVNFESQVQTENFASGIYILNGVNESGDILFSEKFVRK